MDFDFWSFIVGYVTGMLAGLLLYKTVTFSAMRQTRGGEKPKS